MRFGGALGVVEFYSTPNSQTDWRTSLWTKGLAEIFAIGRFGALFLYLEMPELGAGTQGAGGYCQEVYQWIQRNWNTEIPCIIGTPRLISVLSRFPDSQ